MLIFSSCSNTKFLNNGEMLFTGNAKVNYTDKENLKQVKHADEIVDGIIFIQPNNSLLGNRRVLPPLGLWTYNYMKPKKEGGKGNWFYRNFKKDPILVSIVNPELRCRNIENALFTQGFLNAKAGYKIKPKSGNALKAKIQYSVELNEPFKINKIIKSSQIDSIDFFINEYLQSFEMVPGDVFNLEKVDLEKRNIATKLNEKGYFYFSAAYIDFIADTNAIKGQINLLIRKSPSTPAFVLKKYSIADISVKYNYLTYDSTQSNSVEKYVVDNVAIIGDTSYVKPEVIRNAIRFKVGDRYSTTAHQSTLKQFNNYGVFRSVKLNFELADSAAALLNLNIEVVPKDNVSLNLEGYIQDKSTGFIGPGIEVSLMHGNVGRSANQLQFKLTGGFEWQLGSDTQNELGANSFNAGANTAFVFPRFVLPFKINQEKNLFAAKTICDFGMEFLNNVRYYRMTSFTAGLGYMWKKKQKITNVFSPVKINMVNLLETTEQFNSIVDSNVYVKKSFEEQTILGMEYNFIFDNTQKQYNGIYLQAIVGTSGNAASLIGKVAGNDAPYKILGNVFSQFAKASIDLRYLTRTAKRGLIFRLYSGVGYSYGNSTVMPYIEQFYSGGSNSLRGFTARSLGPGSYRPVDQNGIIDQTGDIKLEFNTEYRVPLTTMVLGAFFIDVGNVWLLNEDVNRPGAEFKLNTFSDQLAANTGLGLRFDFDFFVLRTDFGFPLRNTYSTNGTYWVEKKDIIREFRLSFAIGYPF